MKLMVPLIALAGVAFVFAGGLPPFLAQLNLGIVALVVNLVVMVTVSAFTRAAPAPSGRFRRVEQPSEVEWSASR